MSGLAHFIRGLMDTAVPLRRQMFANEVFFCCFRSSNAVLLEGNIVLKSIVQRK